MLLWGFGGHKNGFLFVFTFLSRRQEMKKSHPVMLQIYPNQKLLFLPLVCEDLVHCFHILFSTFFADINYSVVLNKDCNHGSDVGFLNVGHANDDQECKSWCAQRDHCAAFRSSNACYFKGTTCLNNLTNQTDGKLYYKVIE